MNTDDWFSAYLPPTPLDGLVERLQAGNSTPLYKSTPIGPDHPRWQQLPPRPDRPEFDDASS